MKNSKNFRVCSQTRSSHLLRILINIASTSCKYQMLGLQTLQNRIIEVETIF